MKHNENGRRNFLKDVTVGGALTIGLSQIVSSAYGAGKPAKISLEKDDVILFQGDSITDAGRNRDETSANNTRALGSGYALLAGSRLLNAHASKNLKIYNRGISGNKVYQLAERWDADCVELKPSILSILIGIVIDGEGNLYVGDEGNSSVRKISKDGRVATLAGNGKFSFADGVGKDATFNAPGGIAIDTHGNLYVADYLNNCIRKIGPGGQVRKIAGNLQKGFADGPPAEARFYYPFGIAVDRAGVVYVGDQFNHRIRKID